MFPGLIFPVFKQEDWIRWYLRPFSTSIASNSRICGREILEAWTRSGCGEKALCCWSLRSRGNCLRLRIQKIKCMGCWRQLLHTLKFHWSSALFRLDTWSYRETCPYLYEQGLYSAGLQQNSSLDGFWRTSFWLICCMDCWILVPVIHHTEMSKEMKSFLISIRKNLDVKS